MARNYQLFAPLDFLAELTQHIPNQGEHLIRYYGRYSNKARGITARKATACSPQGQGDINPKQKLAVPSARMDRRRWAMLIKRIYQADPLLCPRCGGTMKILAFIEARQDDIIRKILKHCGLWQDPPSRSPPPTTSAASAGLTGRGPASRYTCQEDGDFLDFSRREDLDEVEPTWEP